MLRHLLTAALRRLSRHPLDSCVGIIGLAVGLAAAMLVAVMVREQWSRYRFVSSYENTYLALSELTPAGHAPMYETHTNERLAERIRIEFADIATTARLAAQTLRLRRGAVASDEAIYWADSDFFDVVALPAFAGDLRSALQRPDGVVLCRSVARKYFGRDRPIGEQIDIGGHPMTVTAVIEDLPLASTLITAGVFASGLASFSELQRLAAAPANSADHPAFEVSVQTYVHLMRNDSLPRLQRAMPALMHALWAHRPPGLGASIQLVRIDRVHLFPGIDPAMRDRLAAAALVGFIILIIACVNLANLAMTRAAQRAVEVGVRKACGASRRALFVQFVGESLLHVTLAMCMAVALVECLLPGANAFLGTHARFEYWRDPMLGAGLLLGTLIVTLLVGAYPAIQASKGRAAEAFKAGALRVPGASLRVSLVVAQFSVLIVLMIAATVIYRQHAYATGRVGRLETDRILVIESACRSALKSQLQSLPGVGSVACTSRSLLNEAAFVNIALKDQSALKLAYIPIDPFTLELYRLRPLAGRFFSSRPSDECVSCEESVPADASGSLPRWIINETAARRLGFSSPQAAVGRQLPPYAQVIGVVADFSLNSVEHPISAAVYVNSPRMFELIQLRLSSDRTAETLAAIDRIWRRSGTFEPIRRYFLSDYIRERYLPVVRQAQGYSVFALIALVLAALGLFGLSAATTERRTKEIGVRKAMGAQTPDVMRLLVWQFIKPVLWANVIAWPIGALLMQRWLNGFAYHVQLDIWPFLGAATAALVIALLTVVGHCYLASRARPVSSLRYE